MARQPETKIILSISPEAATQWTDILDFYEKRNGTPDYAIKLDLKLAKLLNDIATQTQMGQRTSVPTVRRRVLEKRFAVFYRVSSDCVEVISIVDGRRNVKLD